MEDYYEFIIPIVGYLLYWFFTSKKKVKPAHTTQKPEKVQPPPQTKKTAAPEAAAAPPEQQDEDLAEADAPEEEEKSAPVFSFEELLDRFSNPEKYQKNKEKQDKLDEITKKAEEQLDESLKPDENFGKPISKELLESIKIKSNAAEKRKKGFDVRRIVSSPQNIRDAFIMKEIFERKHRF